MLDNSHRHQKWKRKRTSCRTYRLITIYCCWLADIILSLDGTLQFEVVPRPTFNIQAIDSTIQDMQLQLNELTEQRHQIELSVVAICLTRMMVVLVKLTVQLGLQFHMGVIITHCLTNGFWNRETLSSLRLTEVVNVVLFIPIKTIWTWIPNVFSFSCLAVSAEDEN